jgi:hypothetical protein
MGLARSGRSVPELTPRSLPDFRKDIVIEIHNEAGQIVVVYMVLR